MKTKVHLKSKKVPSKVYKVEKSKQMNRNVIDAFRVKQMVYTQTNRSSHDDFMCARLKKIENKEQNE